MSTITWTHIKKLTLVDAVLALDSPRKDVNILEESYEMVWVLREKQEAFGGMWVRDLALDLRSLRRRARLPRSVKIWVRTEEQRVEVVNLLEEYEVTKALKNRLSVAVQVW